MPQEIVVPVIRIRHKKDKKGREKTKTRQVAVQVLGANHKITAARHRFKLLQMESVSDRAKPITLKVAVYDTALNEAALYRNVTVSNCPENAWTCLSESLFEHTIHVGEEIAADDVVDIWNCGCQSAGSLSYTIVDDADWLEVLPADGVSPPDPPTPNTHSLTYDVSGLPPGEHFATVTITGPFNVREIMVVVTVETVKPDFDQDGDVDQDDFGKLQACMGPSGVTVGVECEVCDFEPDGDVDQEDLPGFLNCMMGPNVIPDKTCDD